MTNGLMKQRGWRRVGLLGVMWLGVSACQDLQVTNVIAADRERATSNPSDVEAFIAGGFHPPLWNGLHNITQATYLWPAASEFTATFTGGGTLLWWDDLQEPRIPQDNGPVLSVGNGPWGPRNFWTQVTRAASVASDGLQILNEQNQPIMQGAVDVTPRTRAFAKFIQGWSWGYLGLVFDEAHLFDETGLIPSNREELIAVAVGSLKPHPQMIAAAVAALEEAIAIAQANPNVVNYPEFAASGLWFGTQTAVTNQQFIQWANTLAARLLVLSARTPQERAQVDWQKVLQFTANGIQAPSNNFARVLATSGGRGSALLASLQTNTATATTNQRWNYRVIGPADQSGAYQAWIQAPASQRNRFNIVTPDRRITGATPTSNGTYAVYRANDNGFDQSRGQYRYSAYQWRRHALGLGLTADGQTGNTAGTVALISADENTLLRAEAFLRTGNAAAAAELINVTRTRTHGGQSLPPVTAAGVPTVNGQCVPRQDSGACGTLLDALRYERMIELAGMDQFRGYAESRGWGILVDGSLLQFPVPGNELELFGLAGYSYGGVGNPGSATYAPVSNP